MIISLNASATGNTVPTPAFCSLFETSVPGTSTATFTADFYRDDDPGPTGDAAWKALTRGTKGYFIVSRFGGSSVNQMPIAGDDTEVWPVYIVSRAMTNNGVEHGDDLHHDRLRPGGSGRGRHGRLMDHTLATWLVIEVGVIALILLLQFLLGWRGRP